MSLERMTVSLDDFLKYLLKKWKMIVICVMAGAIISVVLTSIQGGKIEVAASEEYLNLKEQELSFEDYIDNSIIMKMDPVNIYEKTLFVEKISDRNSLKDYIQSEEIWTEFDQEIPVKYYTELISWNENETVDRIELEIRHSEELSCDGLAEYVADQIRQFDNNLEVTIGSRRTIIDEDVSDIQMWYWNRLNDIQGQLEINAAGCTIEVSVLMAGILGVLTGSLLAVIILWLKFLFNVNLRSDNEEI